MTAQFSFIPYEKEHIRLYNIIKQFIYYLRSWGVAYRALSPFPVSSTICQIIILSCFRESLIKHLDLETAKVPLLIRTNIVTTCYVEKCS